VGLIYQVAFASHIGHLPRKQQDALLVRDRVIQAPAVQPTVEDVQADDCLIGVADGVTLGPAGEIASRTLLEILAELWRGVRAKAELRPLGARDIRTAQFRFCERLANHARTRGAATTLVMAHLLDDGVHILHVGDSRAYRITAAADLCCLTKDHTAARRLIEEGEIPDCDVEELGSLMRSLDGALIADYAADDFPVDVLTVRLAVGEGLLLCTDGVIDALPRNVGAWWREDKVTDRALRLVQQIMDEVRGEDNATLILLLPSG
jgi:serine/threonine protein phosphatase PrpC